MMKIRKLNQLADIAEEGVDRGWGAPRYLLKSAAGIDITPLEIVPNVSVVAVELEESYGLATIDDDKG